MYRSIVHVDMDAFYASIEQKDNPKLANKPIVVGGPPEARGVVCTASYEARRYGVHSAMPTSKAKKICPQLLIIPVRMERYIEISHHIHEIFAEHTKLIEPISLDEAFLDVSGQNAIEVGLKIKKEIKKKLDLTASVGISHNKFLAKLASGYKKPGGFTIIKESEIETFLNPLPVGKLWGVGPKTERELNRFGIYYVKDILEYDEKIIVDKFGKKGRELLSYARGKDDSPVENKYRRKSLSEENTFIQDTNDIEILREQISKMTNLIVRKIQEDQIHIKTITLKIKYEDFILITRSTTLSSFTNDYKTILKAAEKLIFERISLDKKVRLLGIQVSNILYPDDPVQMELDIEHMLCKEEL